MRKWKYTFHIKQHWPREDATELDYRASAAGIAQELRLTRLWKFKPDEDSSYSVLERWDELNDIVEGLEGLAKTGTQTEIEGCVDHLYDWADNHDVWIA